MAEAENPFLTPLVTPKENVSPATAPLSPYRYDKANDTFITPGLPPKSSRCQMVPPCIHGKHKYSENGKSYKLGRYHWYEEGLVHDLNALKRGKIYTRDDFLERARSWYKAEIDRLTHLERVQEDATELEKAEALAEAENRTVATRTEEPPQDEPPKTPRGRSKKAVPTAPTRIQPPRAAKRKALDAQPVPKSKKAKTKAKDPEPDPEPEPEPPIPEPQTQPQEKKEELPEKKPPETKGDYQLASYDWASYKSQLSARTASGLEPTTTDPNSATTPASPSTLFSWPYVHPQGDAAYFITRLERVIDARVADLESHFAALSERGGPMPMCALGEGYTVEGSFEPAARRSRRESRDERGEGRAGKVLLAKKAVEELGDVEEVEENEGVEVEAEVEEVREAPRAVEGEDELVIEAEEKGVGEVVDVDSMDEDSVVINLEVNEDGTTSKEKKSVVIGVGTEEEASSEIVPNKEPASTLPVFTPIGLNLKTKKEDDDNSEVRDLFNYYSDEENDDNEKQTEQERDMEMERELFGYEGGDTRVLEHESVRRNEGSQSVDLEEHDRSGEEESDKNFKEREISGRSDPNLVGDEDEEVSPLELGPSTQPFPGVDSLVPEADMEISPTFPRWEDPLVENLLSTALEVSGLVFAVDVCGKHMGKLDDVLCLTL